jgi:O-antigen/teichoic acid export membrane protein
MAVSIKVSKYRYLAKNVGLLTVSSFATKLLSFFLVPLYTSVLTTTEYGTYDLFTTTVGVLVPILTLDVQDGVLRFAMDRDCNRSALVTVGVRCTLIGCGIVCAVLLVLLTLGLFPLDGRFAVYFLLVFAVQAMYGLSSAYARGSDRIRDLSVSGVMASVATIGLNIVFLLPMHMGLDGYFLANIIGPIVQVVYLFSRSGMPDDTHLTRRYEKQTRTLLSYAKPLVANNVAWWVNNLSDRYIVTLFCGVAANGVYSVATKIPSILNIFQTIFNQAWSLSSTKDFDPEDKDGFFANTYRAYNCLMVIVCSAIIVADKPLARFLYANDFFVAWQYVPWLTIAILFGALTGYLEGFFVAVKDSKTSARCTVAGAVTNVALNFLLTPIMGPLGASIATAVCYLEVWVLRLWFSRQYIRLRIKLVRDIVSYAIIVVQSFVLLLVVDPLPMYAAIGALFLAVVLLYLCDLRLVLGKALSAVRGGR